MGYVIAKQAYGRERFYSIISQGTRARATWTESLELAERFTSYEDAQDAINSNRDGLGDMRVYVLSAHSARV